MLAETPQYGSAWAALAGLGEPFYDDDSLNTGCTILADRELPQPFRALLVHSNHMTTTLRDYFQQSILLEVLASYHNGDTYSRQILLRTAKPDRLVEFGLVTMHLNLMEQPLQREILRARTPLGDLLMKHDVLRRIEPLWFLKVDPGATLFSPCAGEINNVAYGRIGRIHCNGRPAIELLEVVVAPSVSTPS